VCLAPIFSLDRCTFLPLPRAALALFITGCTARDILPQRFRPWRAGPRA
jgi:hypothetical protein